MLERVELVLHDFLQGLLTIPEASRAVLDTMSEPTDAMLEAGCKAIGRHSAPALMAAELSGDRHAVARLKMAARWKAMVIEALSPSPRVVRVPHRGEVK